MLSLAGPGKEESGWRTNLFWFRALVLTHMAARSLLLMPLGPQADIWEQFIRALINLQFDRFFSHN